ncbi:MAG: alpha/beta fold hydrolase [Bacilli bacterium]
MKKAVLIIHGLAGHPNEHKSIIDYLNKDFDVYTYILPGHDNKLFSRPKAEIWIKVSEEEVEKLYEKGYSDIYVIGHSMGGVIGTYLATKYDCIKKLVLEAPAYFSNTRFNPKIFKYYKLSFLIPTIFKFTPGILKEFKKLVANYKDYPNRINIPILIIQGKDDVFINWEKVKKLYDEVPSKKKYSLFVNDLPHTFCKDKKYNDIMPIIKDFFKNKHFDVKKYDDILLQNKTR